MKLVTEAGEFKYQLTDWFLTAEELKPFIVPFKKYREEADGVIVQGTDGFAIYTRGEYAYTDKAMEERDEEVKAQLKGAL